MREYPELAGIVPSDAELVPAEEDAVAAPNSAGPTLTGLTLKLSNTKSASLPVALMGAWKPAGFIAAAGLDGANLCTKVSNLKNILAGSSQNK